MLNKNYDKIFVEIFDSIFEIIIINFSNYPNFRPISNKVFSVFYWKKKGTNGMLAKFFLISEFELFRKKVMSSIFVENDHWQHHLVRARDPNFWNVLKCNFQNWKIDPILKKNPPTYHQNYFLSWTSSWISRSNLVIWLAEWFRLFILGSWNQRKGQVDPFQGQMGSFLT